jgi:hypothetical protein
LIPFIEIYSLCYVTESTSSGGILKRPSKQLLVWQFFQQNFYFIILKMKFRFCGDQDCPDWLLAEMTTLSRLTSVKTKLTTAQVIQAIIKGNPYVIAFLPTLKPSKSFFLLTIFSFYFYDLISQFCIFKSDTT